MLLVCNWKMNPSTRAEARALLSLTKKLLAKKAHWTGVVAPPAPFLAELSKKRGALALSAQHTHYEEKGSFTGDMSVAQAKDVGCTHILVGHAERRAQGLTNEQVGLIVHRALAAGLSIIICVGEDVRDDHGEYLRTVHTQLHAALNGVLPKYAKKIAIAYEPVWAIGAKEPMSPHEMHQMVVFIRKVLTELYGKSLPIPILYGGAVSGETVRAMNERGGIDGLLVGRASVSEEALTALVAAL